MAKCRVLVDRCTDNEINALVANGFQLDRGSTRVLGSPCGEREACRIWTTAKCANWVSFWERLRHDDLRTTTALTILARCGNCKFEHLAKSLHPTVTLEAARQFDDTIENTARKILGITGFVDIHVLRAALHLRPYAVISAALFDCTEKLCDGVAVQTRTAVHEAITAHYSSLNTLPFLEPQVRAIQGLVAADTLHTATTISCTYACTQHHMTQGLRTRLAVLPKHLPRTCTCGFEFGAVPAPFASINHLLTCNDNHDKTSVTRHNAVVLAIQQVLHLYGVRCTHEPQHLHVHLRPDLHIISLAQQVIIDLTIVDDVHCGADHMTEDIKKKHELF
jgi:hypothetical protein